MTNTQTVSFKLPSEYLRRIPRRNRSEFFREAVREKLAQREPEFKPASPFARKLAALRSRYEASGARLLSPDEIAAEVRGRKGSLA
mgnify:CR=1 FL=1